MSSDNVPTDALDEAEETLQQIAFVFNLRAKRNSLLPVFRLPPETLAIIFIHGARDYYYESDDGGYFTPDIPTWVNISYVCHHWRNVALNCPTLWTYPFHVSLRWTEELLLRSKQALLKISCIFTSERLAGHHLWSSFLDRLLKHSGHTQEFRLCLPACFLPAKLALHALHLEKLEIKVSLDRRDDPVHPLVITDGDKSPLRILKLANCSLPWYSLNLGGLKTLSLCRVHSPSPPNMLEFLTILSGMRDLTALHLENVLPSACGLLSSGGISPKVDLPHLTRLAIVAPVSAVVVLLSSVNIPLKTQLSLEPQFERGCSIDDYHPIISFIAQRFRTPKERTSSALTFRSLSMKSGFIPKLRFSTSERDYEPLSPRSFEDWDHDIPLEVILGMSQPDEIGKMRHLRESDKHRIVSDICCSLPLINVQTLHVIDPELPSSIWQEILGHLDGLRYMKLSDGFMPDLSLLSHTTHEPKENRSGQRTRDQGPTRGHVFVPALEKLELYCISFKPDNETEWLGMSPKTLFDALSTRKGLRDRLTMTKCDTY